MDIVKAISVQELTTINKENTKDYTPIVNKAVLIINERLKNHAKNGYKFVSTKFSIEEIDIDKNLTTSIKTNILEILYNKYRIEGYICRKYYPYFIHITCDIKQY